MNEEWLGKYGFELVDWKDGQLTADLTDLHSFLYKYLGEQETELRFPLLLDAFLPPTVAYVDRNEVQLNYGDLLSLEHMFEGRLDLVALSEMGGLDDLRRKLLRELFDLEVELRRFVDFVVEWEVENERRIGKKDR